MSESLPDPRHASVLKYLQQAPRGHRSAGDLKRRLGLTPKKGPAAGSDASEADRTITGLIERGMIDVGGRAKDGPHPRAGATYRLSEGGRLHLEPTRPDIPETQLKAQEAFILLQLFRATDRRLTRSQLNEKLEGKTAVGQLEFDVKGAPQTVSYHLAALVESGCLIEERRRNSVSYHLDAERGIRALAEARQHDAVTFNLRGETLNALLEAARGSGPPSRAHEEPPPGRDLVAQGIERERLGAHDIESFVDELRSSRYAGKNLIPIHEVRRLVRERFGADDAGPSVFDPLLKHLRGEGRFRLVAIADNRDATQEQLRDSIPGMNETLFYIGIR